LAQQQHFGNDTAVTLLKDRERKITNTCHKRKRILVNEDKENKNENQNKMEKDSGNDEILHLD